LLDLPHVVSGAEPLRVPGLAERCEIVEGDFFESVLAGGDAYILSRVIHDWDDATALKILASCRRAIRPDGRLLLIEGVSKPPNEPDPSKFLDVWFIGGGGCERTEAEYRALLRRGGFELVRVVPTGGPSAILESRPISGDERGEKKTPPPAGNTPRGRGVPARGGAAGGRACSSACVA